jgi:hypothetical protein
MGRLAAGFHRCPRRRNDMQDTLETAESKVDERITVYLETQGQKLSRRGILATVGRLVLRLTGLVLLPLLPLDRRANAQAVGSCSDFTACGMCGYFCKACCGGSIAATEACPSCLNTYSSWTFCCTDPCTGLGHSVTYVDCGSTSRANAAACQATGSTATCGNGCAALGHPSGPSGATFYNSTHDGATYSCTVLVVGAAGEGGC